MVDAVHVIYLWHGWWPQSDEDSESRASTTGSAETRWSNDRRLAMETIKAYSEGISFCCTLVYVKPFSLLYLFLDFISVSGVARISEID